MSHEAEAIFLQQAKVLGNKVIEEGEVALMVCQGDQERTHHLQRGGGVADGPGEGLILHQSTKQN